MCVRLHSIDTYEIATPRPASWILAELDRMVAAGIGPENPLVDGENYTSTLPRATGPRHRDDHA